MQLGKYAKELVNQYKDRLGITYDEAMIIIEQNKTAQQLLNEELALSVTGIKINLSTLMRATLLRDFYDFEPLRVYEKDLIKKYYNIEV